MLVIVTPPEYDPKCSEDLDCRSSGTAFLVFGRGAGPLWSNLLLGGCQVSVRQSRDQTDLGKVCTSWF